ncbi:MAG TPA: DUF2079 domain-containing protein [Methanospirillum sp.]|nr:DUF2079 domain-containing protein [Methanospirillum sp.]
MISFRDLNLQRVTQDPHLLIVLALVCVYILFFSWVGIWWHGLYYTNVDLDIFEQALWTTIHTGDLLWANEYGGSSHFGTHFSPILLLMIPIYALFQHTETIIVLQVIALAAGAIPVYLIASTWISSRAGVCLAGAYLLYPALHGVTTCEFHEIVFFPALFLTSFYLLIQRKRAAYVFCILLTLLIKEDVAMIIGMLGLWGLWYDRNEDLRSKAVHIGVILVAAIFFAAALFIIVPAFNPDGIYPHFSNAYFSTDISPEEAVNSRAAFLTQLIAPLIGIPLFAPDLLLIGLPGFLEIFLPNYPPFWEIGSHYSAIIIPILFIALIQGVKRIRNYTDRYDTRIISIFMILLLISSTVSVILISQSPLSVQFQHVWGYDQKFQPYKLTLDTLIREIDQNKEISVGSHHPLLTHLSRRKNLNTVYNNSSDLIIVAEGYPDGKILKDKIEPEIFARVHQVYDITVYVNKKGKLA